jgi:hypothetical protein
MPNYIFLDTWVYPRLLDAKFEQSLSAFLRKHRYTVLVTSLMLTELYNANWQDAGDKDRMYPTAQFLSKTPNVIVDPLHVFTAELKTYPDRLAKLPTELDLENVPESYREDVLLKLLRRDPLFLEQGIDIAHWRKHYDAVKAGWLNEVEDIINNALNKGYLELDAQGQIVPRKENEALFLMSLDMRHADPQAIDKHIAQYGKRFQSAIPIKTNAIRLTSLYFWYAYVNVDNANRIRRSGSDIGDFYHMSLIPYCQAFTVDNNMYRLLNRVSELPKRCKILNAQQLEALL